MATEINPLLQVVSNLTMLADHAEAHRDELITRCQKVLRENLFSNRAIFHHRSLPVVAKRDAEKMISFFRNPSLSGSEHGAYLNRIGLSSHSVFELGQAHRAFLYEIAGNNPEIMEFSEKFLNSVLDGYFTAQEKDILQEQESFRLAFQTALNRSIAEIQEARSAAQSATETSYRKIILAQEDERRRISRELHDEAGQILIGIHMNLENILNDPSDDPKLRRERLEKAIVLTDNAMQEIRALAYSLRPPVLDLLGIHLTIKQLCLDISESTKLAVTYTGMEFPLLADELAITIYRVVQEALTNIVKHANAKHARISLGHSQGVIELIIRDDGRGFDPDHKTAGIGLAGMRERVRLLNGRLSIKSMRGKYTQLEIILPLVTKPVNDVLSE